MKAKSTMKNSITLCSGRHGANSSFQGCVETERNMGGPIQGNQTNI